MDGECCCCAFVISLFVCFTWVRSAATLFISLFDTNGECLLFFVISLFIGLCDMGHVWGSTAAIHLLFLFSV